MSQPFLEISFFELDLFLALSAAPSIRAAARKKKLEPANVSKIMRRLEDKLGYSLFQRSASGILLTPEGATFIEEAKSVLEKAEKFQSAISTKNQYQRIFNIGAISFLSTHVLPKCLQDYGTLDERTRFRLVEFTHNQLVSFGVHGVFEICVHISEISWTKAWTSSKAGELRWGLYAGQNHSLSATCSLGEIIQYPFVVPTDYTKEGFSLGNDHCPLSWEKRKKGHEAATAETALEIVRLSQHLTFIPTVVAKRDVQLGLVKEISVREWKTVQKPLYLSVRNEKVPQRLQRSFLNSLREILK